MKRKLIHVLATFLLFALWNCGSKSTQESEEFEESEDNLALYTEIMDIHDEVMPKTEELYNIRKQLKENLQNATTDAEKYLLESQINYFDSVDRMMMDWMHEFRQPPDTTSEQARREYYETHLEKIKLVREAILTAIDKGKN